MTYPMSAYPLRCASCLFCENVLQKASPDADWKDPFGGTQCGSAPNPEDGPMPYHEPGSPIVRKPEPAARVFAENPPPPVVPWIPRGL